MLNQVFFIRHLWIFSNKRVVLDISIFSGVKGNVEIRKVKVDFILFIYNLRYIQTQTIINKIFDIETIDSLRYMKNSKMIF